MCVVPGPDPRREPRCPTARELLAPVMPDAVPGPPAGAGVRPAGDDSLDVLRAQIEQWGPEAQERALELIRQRELNPWRPFYCPDPTCDGAPHDVWDFNHARADQRPPDMADDDWYVWLLMGGRGGGKTRTGSEAMHRMARHVPRMRLIGPTGPDIRETMVEGESGLQATAPPGFMPQWEPSKKKVTWPNGAIALGFSGEEPDRLRGPQSYFDWIDEPAAMPLIDGDNGVWNNMLFGLRLGRRPWVCATTTPRSTKWMRGLVAEPTTRISNFSTYQNLKNLAPQFRRMILAKFEGTRLGKQELGGKLLMDVIGALWRAEWISYMDTVPTDDLVRVVVAIDPAGTANKKSDETGIVVLALLTGGRVLVLQDLTDKYSPSGWATAAVNAYEKWSADAIVAESNYGGDMVKEVLRKNGATNIRITLVHSRRGKQLRAEPIAALYEKGYNLNLPTMFHLRDKLEELETEQTTWVPASGMASPNRLDAFVHGATDLAKTYGQATVSTPSSDLMPELAAVMPGLRSA